METGKIIAAASVAAVLFLFALLFFGYQGFISGANRFENQIQARYTDNKNVYDNGWKKVQEIAQVPDIYVAKVKEITEAAIAGRYGNNGAQQIFLAVQEANPTVDASLFKQIQQAVEIFRNELQHNQTELIAVKQLYADYRNGHLSGRVYNSFAGYPRIDLTVFDIVTSDKTETDFGTKRSEPLNLKQ